MRLAFTSYWSFGDALVRSFPRSICSIRENRSQRPTLMVGTRSGKSTASGSASSKISKPQTKKSSEKKAGASHVKREVKKASVAKAKYTVPDVERNSEGVAFFYFRSEPTTRMVNGKDVKFSIQDLKDEPNSTAHWDGVRNYSARNWMRAMRTGDRGFFYHSNAGPDLVGIVGTVTIVKEAYPDHTAWDSGSPYFDAKSSPENPKWEMVDVKLDEIFDSVVTRETLKNGPLGDAYMIKMGRTSVGPVSVAHWEAMLKIAKGKNVEG